MQKILAYPLTIIYFLFFGLILLVFHPIQIVCLRVFGYEAHRRSVVILQFFIMRCLNVLGTRFSFKNEYVVPDNAPLIIVANHQSMYDIPPIIWYMRKYHPKFISKKELGKGIPSISYNLKYGGSVLIDRKKPVQSLDAIERFAKKVEENNWSAVIFPEGTRSRNGVPKPFKTKGLETLINNMSNALIVPITINNSWKTLRYGKFPMGIGAHIKLKAHKPLKVSEFDKETLIKRVEKTITENIKI